MAKKIKAQMNHGRWIAICPVCAQNGLTAAMEVAPGEIFICPEEYPDVLAKTLVPNPRMQGAFNSVPDLTLREDARRTALEAGNVYEVIFPAERKKIEDLLRLRPVVNRNWVDATLDEIRRGNAEKGLPHV